MNKDDQIQGIVFDRHHTIKFMDPPKNVQKVPYYVKLMRKQIKEYSKQYSEKHYKPKFSTDLLPKNQYKQNSFQKPVRRKQII